MIKITYLFMFFNKFTLVFLLPSASSRFSLIEHDVHCVNDGHKLRINQDML